MRRQIARLNTLIHQQSQQQLAVTAAAKETAENKEAK
jgi:hypothetical protein